MCVHHIHAGGCRGQMMVSDPRMKLHVDMSYPIGVLGTEPGFCARAARDLNHGAISPASHPAPCSSLEKVCSYS